MEYSLKLQRYNFDFSSQLTSHETKKFGHMHTHVMQNNNAYAKMKAC
jgi:hypothetical protein